MRRADRLFQIVQILRRRKVTVAADLASELAVSERTIYRDIRDLTLSGVPIIGEAGVGYALAKGFDLPPLMFNEEEIQALVLGIRMVKAWADPELVKAAKDALTKIRTVLPKRLQPQLKETALFAPNFYANSEIASDLVQLRVAARNRKKVTFHYADKVGSKTERTVRPLCLALMVPHWILSAWCELRREFRNFRVDRISGLQVTEQEFVDEPGRTLEDFLKQVG